MDQQTQQVLVNFSFEEEQLSEPLKMSNLSGEDFQQQQQLQILNLFERVADPFTPKPDIAFDVVQPSPGDDERFKPAAGGLNIPELELVKAIPRGRLFSSFHPGHREAAYTLIRIFKNLPTVQDMINLAAAIRDDCNEHLYVFALSAAIIQRPDARTLRVPPIFEVFPDKFIDSPIRSEATTVIQRSTTANTEEPIIINKNFAATDRVFENKLSYFREDLGINSHHWHWHLIYPVEGGEPRDRRGELFYYMHQQILARYDAERISNGLARVTSFHDWDQPIPEAYFPKLTTANGAIHWGSRPSGLVLRDINIPDEGSELGIEFQIQDLERWRTRILHAIHKGSVENVDGQVVPLDEETGTNILGELIEASEWSANKLLYGDMHNFGHMAMCYIHDPDRSHLENMGVMGDSVTAMRDPIFYRWHKFIDSLFQQFKATLKPYTAKELTLEGITLHSITVITSNTSSMTSNSDAGSAPELLPQENVIITGWQESIIELTRGLDFSSRTPVQARVTHLQHEDFAYKIYIENASETSKEVVLRIFLAPNKDETGRQLSFREQRLLMIELDKFVEKVEPGNNVISRTSNDSSVTIPFERTFRELERPDLAAPLAPGGVPTDLPTDARFNMCGCGWPDHFLVPRGAPTQAGMPFTLFAMATSWEEDRVVNETGGRTDCKKVCRNAASYCGILDEKYPDKRSMGFPFDRPPDKKTTTLGKFIEKSPNITTTEIRIRFEDRVIRRYPR